MRHSRVWRDQALGTIVELPREVGADKRSARRHAHEIDAGSRGHRRVDGGREEQAVEPRCDADVAVDDGPADVVGDVDGDAVHARRTECIADGGQVREDGQRSVAKVPPELHVATLQLRGYLDADHNRLAGLNALGQLHRGAHDTVPDARKSYCGGLRELIEDAPNNDEIAAFFVVVRDGRRRRVERVTVAKVPLERSAVEGVRAEHGEFHGRRGEKRLAREGRREAHVVEASVGARHRARCKTRLNATNAAVAGDLAIAARHRVVRPRRAHDGWARWVCAAKGEARTRNVRTAKSKVTFKVLDGARARALRDLRFKLLPVEADGVRLLPTIREGAPEQALGGEAVVGWNVILVVARFGALARVHAGEVDERDHPRVNLEVVAVDVEADRALAGFRHQPVHDRGVFGVAEGGYVPGHASVERVPHDVRAHIRLDGHNQRAVISNAVVVAALECLNPRQAAVVGDIDIRVLRVHVGPVVAVGHDVTDGG
eukprot:Opistho-1_new@106910